MPIVPLRHTAHSLIARHSHRRTTLHDEETTSTGTSAITVAAIKSPIDAEIRDVGVEADREQAGVSSLIVSVEGDQKIVH